MSAGSPPRNSAPRIEPKIVPTPPTMMIAMYWIDRNSENSSGLTNCW